MSPAAPAATVQVLFRSVARNAGSTLGASTVVLLSVAIANVLVARLLGANGQGQVAAATLVPMIVAYLGELGIPAATGYLINVKSERRADIIATARSVDRALALILVVIAALLILVLPLPPDVRPYGLLFCAFVPLNLFYRLHLTILQADWRLKAFNRLRIGGAMTYVTILVVYAATGSATVLGVVAALLMGNIVWCWSAVRFANSRPKWGYDRQLAQELFRYGIRAHAGNVSVVDGLKVDQLVLALFLSTSELGLYVAAMTIVLGNRLIGISTGTICFPLACKRDPENSDAQTQFRILLGATLVLSAAVAIVEFVMGGRLLTLLFGPPFEAAGPALQVLAVGSVFMNLRQASAEWLRGSGRPGVAAISELLGIVSLLILGAILWDGSILRVAWIVSISAAVSCAWLAYPVFSNQSKGDEAEAVSIDGESTP